VKIAVLHSFYDRRSPSGENSVVEDQVAQLQAVGHEVQLIARYSDQLSASRLYPARAAIGAATQRGAEPLVELERFQPDVVHCHNLFPNWGSRWLDVWAERTVATVHNYRSVCAAATLHRAGHDCQLCPLQGTWHAMRNKCYRDSLIATAPLAWASRKSGKEQRLINNAQHVIFLNDEAADTMTRLIRIKKYSVTPNFVTPPRIPEQNAGNNTWLFAGRLTEEKGVRSLLAHWPRRHRLLIIGDGPLRNLVQQRASAEPRTFTYSPLVPREELMLTIATAIGVVVPSLWKEGLPTIVLEALAAHKPVLLSQNCSSTVGLVNKGGVLSFDPLSTDDLDTKIGNLLREYDAFAISAAETYKQFFSPEAWTKQIQPIYESLSH
jgi:glycosyltransferase involved in cell wall biosynthesis